MTPREIIANVRDVINAACLNLNHRCDSTYATAVLEALHSAGYRIIGPGELDPETVEKCAEAVRKLPDRRYADNVGYVTVPPNREDFATAIRALAKEKQGC
jgi:hypothetical protein